MNLPSLDYHALNLSPPPSLPKGLDSLVNAGIGLYNRRSGRLENILDDAEKIVTDSLQYRYTSEGNLRQHLKEMQMVYRRNRKDSKTSIAKVYSLLTEASYRTLGIRPYPMQIVGAMALRQGFLAEMATGEGKSLTACFPAILAGWTGRPCHIVTVNDYLANRDAEEMQGLYAFCGLTVGWVGQEMEEKERRYNYQKHIVYLTAKELLADFLRDRLKLGTCQHPSRRMIRQMMNPRKTDQKELVMRGLDTAIVDEADSVLIDEAVTPLIISGYHENEHLLNACQTAYSLSKILIPAVDYQVNRKYREIYLTERGNEKINAHIDELPGIWKGKSRREELLIQALSAREFYHRDVQYVKKNDTIIIVDEFTGRLMPNRTWKHGLQQAVEAQEEITLSQPSETLASLSFQKFFRLFRHLSGLTGTAHEAKEEFWSIYRLPVLKIPTNKPCLRKSFPNRFFDNKKKKWDAIVREIIKYHNTGRPVLIGTRSVKASQKLADTLSHKGLQFNLLNALQHKEEAAIVASAGQKKNITIATNMAGRGTDIKLGPGVDGLGGLHVIATERHESSRIDRQLFGRCARQGFPGSTQAFINIDDELLRRFLPSPIQKCLSVALAKKLPGAQTTLNFSLGLAQKTAERIAYRRRKTILNMDTWLEEALSFGSSDKRM